MPRLSLNQMTTFRWSFDEDVVQSRAHGYTTLGVWRQKLADFGEERGIDLLRESGLRVSNFLWAGGFTGSDMRSFRESVDDALEALRLAAELSSECLVLYTGGRAGHTHNHARRLLRDAVRELAPAAQALGVCLALEPMHPSCAGEWTFLTSLEETLATLDDLGQPALKLVFDTYHLGCDPLVFDLLPHLAPRVAVVHLADSKCPPNRDHERCRLGEGTIDLVRLMRELETAGYQGVYDVELLGEEIEATDYGCLLDHSRTTFDRLLAAATG